MGCRGGFLTHLNSSRGVLSPSLSEGREGDQNGDFGWILLRREGGILQFSPTSALFELLDINWKLQLLRIFANLTNHHFDLFKIWDLNFVKVQTKLFALNPSNYELLIVWKVKALKGKAIYFVNICSFNPEYPPFTTDIWRHSLLSLLFRNTNRILFSLLGF